MSELARVHDDLFGRIRARSGLHWWLAFAVCAGITALLFSLIAYTVATGIGVWGTNIPAAWAQSLTERWRAELHLAPTPVLPRRAAPRCPSLDGSARPTC